MMIRNEFSDYDAGLINDHGGGDVGWWQDYIRSEIQSANEHWRAQIEQRADSAVPEGWKLVPTKEKLSDLLVVGTEILVGPIYAEKHGFVEGDVLTLVEGRFEYDNGLYTEDQRAPSVWNAEEQEFYSIFHLFENDLSGFLDCEVVGAVEGALLSAQPIEQSTPHWSASNPGLADQYRAEAMAARTALGFAESAENVSPADIRVAVAALADSAVPDGWCLMPDIATNEMLETGWPYLEAPFVEDRQGAYADLCAAAPAPPITPEEQQSAIQRKYKDWAIVRQSESAISIASGATYVTFSADESDKRIPWLVDFLSSLLAGSDPTPQPAEPHPDTFSGDNDALIRSARSLLNLDAKGALVPGGIGSDARCIITAFIARMERQQVIAEQAFSSMHGQAVSVGDSGRIRDAVDDMGKRNRAGAAQMADMVVGDRHPAPAVQGEPASRVVPSRDDLIQCLLATHGQSEGTTADAILSMLTAAPQPAEQQPDVAGLVEALEEIAASRDSGRHDGLPEEGPALDDVEAWLVARAALAAHRKPSAPCCGDPGDWVPISERLPELNQPVVLININRFENVGGDWERHVQDAGYLAAWGDGRECKYWSVRGARAIELSSYTHWLPLPAAPVTDGEGQ